MWQGNLSVLRLQLIRDEGVRLKPYVDTEGKITIGCGRNLSDNGISMAEAMAMLDVDLPTHVADLERMFPLVKDLTPGRQIALGDMAFNLGLPRLAHFTKMWDAIKAEDFDTAAAEMLNSTWATQVGDRAVRLAHMMKTGVLPA